MGLIRRGVIGLVGVVEDEVLDVVEIDAIEMLDVAAALDRVQITLPADAFHGQRLLQGHGVAHQLAQGVVHRFPLGAEVVARHGHGDQLVVQVDVGPAHGHEGTPLYTSWCGPLR